MASFRVVFLFVLSLLFVFTNRSTSDSTTTTSSCKSIIFSNNKTFDNCIDLSALKAILHYTYNPTLSTLSIAFTARPPTPTGWISWALNPKDVGMIGAQTLVAYKPDNTNLITINQINIKSYKELVPGPLSYNVTDRSALESNGDVTIFATWAIPHGETSVNTVWQVGPVINGKPGKHDFNPDNLNAKLKLGLVNGPAGAPALSPAGAPTKTPAEAPTKTHSGSAQKSVVSVFMILVVTSMVCF
ncbi:hypothetical protein RND81_01G149200 [Saponaria officinalis]|uniref:DOMON domain-containing protein n=1 Tax=Saponaria officinalis TaxID=3572 RepID=A0AAW1NA22_SAPOF